MGIGFGGTTDLSGHLAIVALVGPLSIVRPTILLPLNSPDIVLIIDGHILLIPTVKITRKLGILFETLRLLALLSH